MTAALSPSIARLAAIGLAVALAAALWSGIVLPLWAMHTRDGERIEAAMLTLEQYRRLAGARAGLEAALAGSGEQPVDELLLPGTSDALAAAALQERVQEAVRNAGAVLSSITILPPVEAQAYRRISLDMRLGATDASLRDMLWALESGRPYLFVQRLTIARAGGAAWPNAGSIVQPLDVLIEIFSYRRSTNG